MYPLLSCFSHFIITFIRLWSICHFFIDVPCHDFHHYLSKSVRKTLSTLAESDWFNWSWSSTELSVSSPGSHCFVKIVATHNIIANSSLLPSGSCLALYIQCVHNLPGTLCTPVSDHDITQVRVLSTTGTNEFNFSVRPSDSYWFVTSSKSPSAQGFMSFADIFRARKWGWTPEWEVLLCM